MERFFPKLLTDLTLKDELINYLLYYKFGRLLLLSNYFLINLETLQNFIIAFLLLSQTSEEKCY